MKLEPIRLRLTTREPSVTADFARDEFWRTLGDEGIQSSSISEAEGKLRREFGPALRQLLVQEIAEPLRQFDENLNRGELRNLEHLFFRFGPDSDKYWDRGQALDALARMMEQRQQLIRESPSLRRVQERLAAASVVTFAVRIAGYSSLNLDLSVGSLSNLAEVFEHDFESFRVFLEAFVPQVFGRVFYEAQADKLNFEVHIPSSYEQAFAKPPAPPPPLAPGATTSAVTAMPASPAPAPSSGRERAEWLWRLANGSLLVPFLLALAVMYYGLSMLKDVKSMQAEALKPILDHQLKLLEEDRRRMFRDVAAPSSASSSAPAATR